MTRNLKALGLAFVAVFAMSAIAASVAHAEEQFFHSHSNPTIITGENTGTGHEEPHTFTLIKGFTVSCKKAKFEGTEEATSTHETAGKATTYTTKTLTVTPTYEECEFAGHPMTIDTKTNECHFVLYAETTETTAKEPMGNMEVICKKEPKTINTSVPALGIEIHIGNQLVPHILHYETVNTTTETEKQELTITTTPKTSPGNSGIAWSCTPKATCTSALGVASGTEATYLGKVTAKGFKDKEKTATGTYLEEAQTGIFYGPTQ